MIEIQSASVSDHLFLHIRNIAFFKTNARANNLGGKKSSQRIHPRSIENGVFSVERIKRLRDPAAVILLILFESVCQFF